MLATSMQLRSTEAGMNLIRQAHQAAHLGHVLVPACHRHGDLTCSARGVDEPEFHAGEGGLQPAVCGSHVYDCRLRLSTVYLLYTQPSAGLGCFLLYATLANAAASLHVLLPATSVSGWCSDSSMFHLDCCKLPVRHGDRSLAGRGVQLPARVVLVLGAVAPLQLAGHGAYIRIHRPLA